MRPDMAKVIVERPRVGGKHARVTRPKEHQYEDLPQKEGMRKPYGYNSKELNENLAPLKRYLHSQIGRPWDKVHSEICQHIKLNSTVQRHILQHLEHMVETNTYLGKDGKVYTPNAYGPDREINDTYSSYNDLYVHPASKLLRKIKPKQRPNKVQEIKRVDVSKAEQYHKIKGVWFSISIKEIPKTPLWEMYNSTIGPRSRPTVAGYIIDHHLKLHLAYCVPTSRYGRNHLVETYGREVYAISKRQLNSKELRKTNLKNDPQN